MSDCFSVRRSQLLLQVCPDVFRSSGLLSSLLCPVSAGFPKSLTFSIFNTSCVPLTFDLRILGDGLGPPSVSYEDHLSDVSRNDRQVVAVGDTHGRPAEFTISPSSACASPQSHVLVQVVS